jgi:hypothetical protein
MAYEPTRYDRPSGGRHGNGNGGGNGNGNGGNYNAAYPAGSAGAASTNDQIRDILHVVFKRRRLIAVLFLAVALPGVLASVLRRPDRRDPARSGADQRVLGQLGGSHHRQPRSHRAGRAYAGRLVKRRCHAA